MFTFKSNSDKSNAKRFLVKTAKVDNFELYLTSVDGKWGTYLDEAGVPVPFATVEQSACAATETAPAAKVLTPDYGADHNADGSITEKDSGAVIVPAVAQPEPEEPAAPAAPVANAFVFGAQAIAQLTATPTAAAQAAVVAEVTGTTGLKIEKNREMRNGVTRYSKGSVGAKLWDLFDTVGPTLTLPQARELAAKHGLNTTSAGIGLYSWRRFHGYGRPAGETK